MPYPAACERRIRSRGLAEGRVCGYAGRGPDQQGSRYYIRRRTLEGVGRGRDDGIFANRKRPGGQGLGSAHAGVPAATGRCGSDRELSEVAEVKGGAGISGEFGVVEPGEVGGTA